MGTHDVSLPDAEVFCAEVLLFEFDPEGAMLRFFFIHATKKKMLPPPLYRGCGWFGGTRAPLTVHDVGALEPEDIVRDYKRSCGFLGRGEAATMEE